jgi:hypothetical protein
MREKDHAMTQTSKPVSQERKVLESRVLKDDELDAVSGGGMLSSAVSQTIKTFGRALNAAARV